MLVNNFYRKLIYYLQTRMMVIRGTTNIFLAVSKMMTFTNNIFWLVLMSNCDKLQYILVKRIPSPLFTNSLAIGQYLFTNEKCTYCNRNIHVSKVAFSPTLWLP